MRAGGAAGTHGDELAAGDEAVAAGEQAIEGGGHGVDAGGVDIVHKDDAAGFGVSEDAVGDDSGAGALPVLGVD